MTYKLKNILNEIGVGISNSYCSAIYKPLGAIVFLTYRCTSRCNTCNIWKWGADESKELSWDEWKPIFSKISKSGIKAVEFFGGDALLKKDVLYEMIRFCRDAGIETYYPTNSNLLDEESARSIVEAGLDVIYFSLDEVPAIEGVVRGVDNHFEKVDKAAGLMYKYRSINNKPEMVCITTVSNKNYAYLDEFIEYINKSCFDRYVLRGLSEFPRDVVSRSEVDGIMPKPYFMTPGNESNLVSCQQAEDLLENLRVIIERSRTLKSVPVSMTNMESATPDKLASGKYPFSKCLFMSTQMVLTPAGNVVPCLYYTNNVLGNLCEAEISQIWGNDKHVSFCKQQRNGNIELCNYCSIKFYHRSFGETLDLLIRKANKRLFSK